MSVGAARGPAHPVAAIRAFGQSVWLDRIRRRELEDGTLRTLLERDRVCGLTSDPTIFANALAMRSDYEVAIAVLAARSHDAREIGERLMLQDIGNAADMLAGAHRASAGDDGYVGVGVAPALAHDTRATIAEARRLVTTLARPNVMIELPATREALGAIRSLIAEGINVNATLLFGVDRYREVVDAWLAGLEDRVASGAPLSNVASVASFFLSHIDAAVDARLDANGAPAARALRGRAAIATARLAYGHLQAVLGKRRWRALADRGARPQRLLWAATSAQDPACDSLKYVEPLIGPGTVTTLTPATLEAYRNRGRPALRLTDDRPRAARLPAALLRLGIDLPVVAAGQQRAAVEAFARSADAIVRQVTNAMPR